MTRAQPFVPPPSKGPPASALQSLLDSNEYFTTSEHPKYFQDLAVQTLHNLQHQHLWTDLRIHTHSPLPPSGKSTLLSRPLISGLPPQRLYIHPDEQIALLQEQKALGGTGMGEVKAEREWVLPSHLREKWTLRRFGEVFDHIGIVPPDEEDEKEEQEVNKWRTTKRVLLATVDDDTKAKLRKEEELDGCSKWWDSSRGPLFSSAAMLSPPSKPNMVVYCAVRSANRSVKDLWVIMVRPIGGQQTQTTATLSGQRMARIALSIRGN
ncbi:hypothetical protein M8818_003175 [Zalaria obscura]|uniref:Uncharacterized protein n=1 Tax=Zalaria obscura TaxID=2024903 RepID=A0ACC3SFV5_9PEZI